MSAGIVPAASEQRGELITIVYPPDCTPASGSMNVYVVYDGAHGLLYIGQTVDVRRRLRQHRRADPWWWEEAAEVWVIAGKSRDEAASIECAMIEAARPPGNYQHNRRVVVTRTPA